VSGWLRFSILAMLAYGVWGLVSSLASQTVSSLTLQIVSTVGLFPVTLVLMFSKNIHYSADRSQGILLAMVTGVWGEPATSRCTKPCVWAGKLRWFSL
jgi:hypothetical protein